MELPISEFEQREKLLQREIAYQLEVLQKAEKYERLMESEDFKAVLKDIEMTVTAHQREIQNALSGLSEYTSKEREEAYVVILSHQILKEQAEQAIKRPLEVLSLA